MKKSRNKSFFPKRAIHFDFHTMPAVPDVGRDFDAEKFSETLEKTGVQYITFFARCNIGFAYYPTKIGIPHPGLQKKDLLGSVINACHRRNIQVAAYLNAGLDHEHAVQHRDWCKVNQRGQVFEIEKMGNFFRKMCLNTEYREYLYSMIEEILSLYPVDGIFLDCFTSSPCFGDECVRIMQKKGIDVKNIKSAEEFAYETNTSFCREIEDLIEKRRKGINLYFNGMPYAVQPTHIELEILPTGGWGYESLFFANRYARTLKKPVLTMTGRFHKGWGDFGGIRTFHSLRFDCLGSIAGGASCMVGDHLHPRGNLEPPVYRLIGEIFDEIKEIEPWVEHTTPCADIAIIHPGLSRWPAKLTNQEDLFAVQGTARMLSELKYQFDVRIDTEELSRYKVLILPDTVSLNQNQIESLESYLESGGKIIASSWSLVNREKEEFCIKEYPVSFEGEEEFCPSFFTLEEESEEEIPNMPIAIYQKGIAMKASEESSVIAHLHKPYFNDGFWDGRHEYLYTPPDRKIGRPGLARNSKIAHFSFPIFSGYFKDTVLSYKKLLALCLKEYLEEPLLKSKNLPSFCQGIVAKSEKELCVHLILYSPETRGEKMMVLEEPGIALGVKVGIRDPEHLFSRAILAPEGIPLESTREDKYLWTELKEVEGYALIVFQKDEKNAL